MKPDLKRFLGYLIKAALLILVLDFSIGSAMEFLHGRMKGGERARAHFAINKSAADVYVFGSSRALYHYDPQILQDSLGLTVYNAGRSAQTMLYHLPVLKMILKRHMPKLVVLDINENEFVLESRKYDLVNSLLPYYRTDEGVREMVDLVKPGYRYFSWSHTLPFNSSLFSILYRSMSSKGERTDFNGYIFMNGHRTMDVTILHNCDAKISFDPKIIQAFHEFVELCRKNNIRLLVVTSPRFLVADCPRADFQRVKEEMAAMNVDFIDFSGNRAYVENLDYMYDESHLNHEGSTRFTREIAGYLKQKERK